MIIISSQMVWKRKHVACIDPKKTNVHKKAPTKGDLMEEMKLVKQLNIAIAEEIIAILEKNERKLLDTIEKLESNTEKLYEKESKTDGTQTSAENDDSVLICCNLCIYTATCEEQLTWHMGEDHDKETNYFDTDFPCDICGKWRRSGEDLAHHLKKHEVCTTAPTVPPKSIQCNFCTEMFLSIRDLMVHKKKEHVDKVSSCRNHTNGTCDFGDLQCWFSHANQTSSMTFKSDMRKGADTRTLSAEIFMECGNFRHGSLYITLIYSKK